MGDKTMRCARCGKRFKRSHQAQLGQHRETCDRVPLTEELCDLLDEDPALSVRALAARFNCSYGFLMRRLAGSRWSVKRLRRRGYRAASLAQVSRSKPWATRGGRTCARCRVLLASCNMPSWPSGFGILCFHCVYELGIIARRLMRPGGLRYALNRVDLEYFRRYRGEESQPT